MTSAGLLPAASSIGGGFEYDGKELAPFDREEAEKFFTDMKEKGVKSIAVYLCLLNGPQ